MNICREVLNPSFTLAYTMYMYVNLYRPNQAKHMLILFAEETYINVCLYVIAIIPLCSVWAAVITYYNILM